MFSDAYIKRQSVKIWTTILAKSLLWIVQEVYKQHKKSYEKKYLYIYWKKNYSILQRKLKGVSNCIIYDIY